MANRTKLTAKKRALFLERLEHAPHITDACKAIGISRTRMYELKDQDAEFKVQWDQAVEQGLDALEKEAWRRAVEGTNKPVIYKGVVTDTFKEYSDTLLIFLMKNYKREQFGERVQHEHKVDVHAVLDLIPIGVTPRVLEGETIEQEVQQPGRPEDEQLPGT